MAIHQVRFLHTILSALFNLGLRSNENFPNVFGIYIYRYIYIVSLVTIDKNDYLAKGNQNSATWTMVFQLLVIYSPLLTGGFMNQKLSARLKQP